MAQTRINRHRNIRTNPENPKPPKKTNRKNRRSRRKRRINPRKGEIIHRAQKHLGQVKWTGSDRETANLPTEPERTLKIVERNGVRAQELSESSSCLRFRDRKNR